MVYHACIVYAASCVFLLEYVITLPVCSSKEWCEVVDHISGQQTPNDDVTSYWTIPETRGTPKKTGKFEVKFWNSQA